VKLVLSQEVAQNVRMVSILMIVTLNVLIPVLKDTALMILSLKVVSPVLITVKAVVGPVRSVIVATIYIGVELSALLSAA
jgi:hypothetical protein